MSDLFDTLFILEMANNHMGDLEHGLEIIRQAHAVCRDFPFRFAIKFQYRELDTFIHPDYQRRDDLKYVKRFRETRLADDAFLQMKAEAGRLGFLTACTPFDEPSVARVAAQGFDLLKIASCSFTDWPLLEHIARTELPIVASTAGVTIEDVDRVVAFFQHRRKPLCLMHCVGSYPTPDNELELNQIDLFRGRYPDVAVGFSTHEHPDTADAVKLALAKGARVFERHIGVATPGRPLNAYSSSPEQLRRWLQAAQSALVMCGVSGRRRDISAREAEDLRGLKRGVFARRPLEAGADLTADDLFLAIPNRPGQLLANDLSKYVTHTLRRPLAANAPVLVGDVASHDRRQRIVEIVRKLAALLGQSNVRLQNRLDLELSHHYGLDQFERWGCAIINCINREYCKKIIMLLPGQENPCHTHRLKEETFHVLHGELRITLGGQTRGYGPGELVTVERGVPHSFASTTGAIFEEVSTTHYREDSYYEDPAIQGNPHRKTEMTFWADWLCKTIA